MSALLRLLWQELAAVPEGMLGLEGETSFQPLFHIPQPADPVIWFLIAADSDLAKALPRPRAAHYLLTGTGRLFAHLSGTIAARPDRQGLEKAWSPRAEARMAGGLTDIEWLPMRFAPETARLWLPGAGPDDPLHREIEVDFGEWAD